jgi:hypothetical protein
MRLSLDRWAMIASAAETPRTPRSRDGQPQVVRHADDFGKPRCSDLVGAGAVGGGSPGMGGQTTAGKPAPMLGKWPIPNKLSEEPA